MEENQKQQYKTIVDTVIPTIRPDNSASRSFVEGILSGIQQALDVCDLQATCEAGGSYAKETNLKGDFDIDVFIRFDSNYQDQKLSDHLEQALEKLPSFIDNTIDSYERVHGSRDYFQLTISGFTFELVPVYSIRDPSKAINVTDMSPLHVHWVREHMKQHPLNDDVRLAKVFCKACGVYGAESYIEGFSGHVLDILIIHYGGFLPFLKAASEWQQGTIIDPEEHYGSAENVRRHLNDAKLLSPIILIDPIDPYRNAAAALSTEKFTILRKKARSFLEQPSSEYFRIKPFSLEDIKNEVKEQFSDRDVRFITAHVTALSGNKDRAGAKMRKAYRFLRDELKRQGFSLLTTDWHFDKKNKGHFYFALDTQDLPDTMEHIGPPLRATKHAETFASKYQNDPNACLQERNGRYIAIVKRPFTKPLPLLKKQTDGPYIQSLVKDISLEETILSKSE
jgi:tRNA nucleotidyltransferase (CCA-adding enzyme)